mmetsp:Transcript_67223/g.118844  ORF Transcript_67223/g.118844 Transcript_67223/m.118844 type:complete len:232 (+) Transcript_67223:555-1250(+)
MLREYGHVALKVDLLPQRLRYDPQKLHTALGSVSLQLFRSMLRTSLYTNSQATRNVVVIQELLQRRHLRGALNRKKLQLRHRSRYHTDDPGCSKECEEQNRQSKHSFHIVARIHLHGSGELRESPVKGNDISRTEIITVVTIRDKPVLVIMVLNGNSVPKAGSNVAKEENDGHDPENANQTYEEIRPEVVGQVTSKVWHSGRFQYTQQASHFQQPESFDCLSNSSSTNIDA